MPINNEEQSLVAILRKNGRLHLLTNDEQSWLASPEVSQLSTQEQWELINSNRKIAYGVQLFAGGLRLLLLLGGAAALIAFALIPDALPAVQDQATKMMMLGFGGLLLIAAIFLLRGLLYRLSKVKPLPDMATFLEVTGTL